MNLIRQSFPWHFNCARPLSADAIITVIGSAPEPQRTGRNSGIPVIFNACSVVNQGAQGDHYLFGALRTRIKIWTHMSQHVPGPQGTQK
jgi:hypothetical protein